jgi:UDP-N-acetylglucosamine 2-epimerase
MRVCTIVGTRPEIIRLSRLIPQLDRHFEHVLVHTGQNQAESLSGVFFDQLSIRSPDHFLEVPLDSLGSQLSEMFSRLFVLLSELKPHAVVILGDTNSALAAILCRRMGITVYHIEAGNRSFDWNVPEEINRRIVDHCSNFNLVYSEHARRNLLREGVSERDTFLVGSPMREVFTYYEERIMASRAVEELGLNSNEFFLVSAHRQENVDSPDRLRRLFTSISRICDEWNIPGVVSTHPRTRQRLNALGDGMEFSGLKFLEPLGFLDYCKLQIDALCVLSDSGSVSEESAIMGFRAVTLRESMERPEALESAVAPMAGIDFDTIRASIEIKLNSKQVTGPADYDVQNTAHRVVEIVQSTLPYVNQRFGLR